MNQNIIPLAKPDLVEEDFQLVKEVLQSGMLVQGKYVAKLEEIASQWTASKYCSAVSNGTASLHLALIALGIGPGDEVVVPAFSYVATANVVELVGAKCVFVDINIDSFNIDVEKIETAISPQTKAIIPVHEFGLCANMSAIMKLAQKYDLRVIEDAACALGATWEGQAAGSFGDFGSFSLHPRKAITSGEGGLLTTQDDHLDKVIKTLRNHGIEPTSRPMNFVAAGFNYRLTDIQGALVYSQFSRFQKILTYKQKLATIYFDYIKHPGVTLPSITTNATHTWQTFHIMLPSEAQRDKLKSHLSTNGIQSNIGAQCIPATTFYHEKYGYQSIVDFPNAWRAYSCGLAIPLHPLTTEKQIQFISETVNNFC